MEAQNKAPTWCSAGLKGPLYLELLGRKSYAYGEMVGDSEV